MKGIAIIDKGLEDISIEEISEKINSKGKKEDTIVIFPIKQEEELCKLAYTCQSVKKILLIIKEIKVETKLEKNTKELKKAISKDFLKKYSSKKINVECERIGDHDFTSVDFAKEISLIINKEKIEVSRKEYDTTLFAYIYNDKGYLCIDYSGRDLSKRNYRLFTKAGTLKGTLGYSLIKIAKYKPGEIIIDPNCEAGVIPIETTMYALQKPINFYKKEFLFQKINKKFEVLFQKEDKRIKKTIKNIHAFDRLLSNIHSAKKNAKVAGVDKNISFSKLEIEWLDTKFEKNSIDKIVTKLPSESKRFSKKIIEKTFQEFFYQAEFVIKKKGLVVVCSLKNELLKEVSKKKNFKIVEEKKIFSGQQEYMVTVFQKSL